MRKGLFVFALLLAFAATVYASERCVVLEMSYSHT